MGIDASGSSSSQFNRREVVAAALGGGLALSGCAAPTPTSGVRTLTSAEQLRPNYDHVIIGAGSAGCVLGCRLARAGRRVLLIEAGGPAALPAIADPPEWPKLQGSSVDWRYQSVPQPGLAGRVVAYPRGKVVGGSSAINALAYQRGHPAAYDRWPAGWQFADLLPYFKRAETFSGGASQWRGGDGPLHVLSLADVPDRTPVASAFIQASRELGFPMTPDLGGAITTGVGWNQLSIRGQRRDDAATAYLGYLDGAAVDLLIGTQVLGLAIKRGRCIGVRLPDRVVRPDMETLLCAGAIDSPRLLMLSGIGPSDHLRFLDIPVVQDLAGVGNHLEDHLLLAGVAYTARQNVARSHYNHADAVLYVPRSNPGESPEILIMCLSLPFVLPTVGSLDAPAYVLVPCLMRPRSRGSVRLSSSDPLTPAIIEPRYLSEAADHDILVEGVGLAREIGSAAAFAEWRGTEVYPGPGWSSRADRRRFIQQAANSFHHPMGTCRMGAVVDMGLRVNGVEGLRVVDASVLPDIPQAMINAAVIAIAEKASDLLLQG